MTNPAAAGGPQPPVDFRQVHRAIMVGFGLALIVLLLLGGLSLQSANETVGNAREVARTFELLGTLDGILGRVTDAETGSRGFVITGSDSFLEPYDSAVQALPGELARLTTLLGSRDATQRQSAVHLDSLVRAKLAFIELVTARRREGGLRPAAALVETRRGKETMDSIRRTVAGIETRQRALLGENVASLLATERQLKLVIALGTAAAALVVLFSMLAIRKQLSARQRAEIALRRSEHALQRSEEQLLQWVVGRREPPSR